LRRLHCVEALADQVAVLALRLPECLVDSQENRIRPLGSRW